MTITSTHTTGRIARRVLLGAIVPAIMAGAALTCAPAAHAADTTAHGSTLVGHAMASQGFLVQNLTQYDMRLDHIAGDDSFDGRPADGSIMKPGGRSDIEVVEWAFTTQRDTAYYDLLDRTGKVVGHTVVDMTVDDGDRYATATGDAAAQIKGTAGDVEKDGRIPVIFAPDKSDITLDGSNAQAQANVLQQLCENDNGTCSFDAHTEKGRTLDPRPIGSVIENEGDTDAEHDFDEKDTVSQTNSVDVGVKTGGSLFGIIDVEVSAKYGHEWTAEHTYAESLTHTVKPGEKAWLTTSVPVLDTTGDFTATLGGTTWHLTNVTFTSPDASKNAVWTIHTQPIGGGAITSTRVS